MRSIRDVPSTLTLREQHDELADLGVAEWEIAKRLGLDVTAMREMLAKQDQRAASARRGYVDRGPGACADRLERVAAMTQAGASIGDIAAALGVCRGTVSEYRRRIREVS